MPALSQSNEEPIIATIFLNTNHIRFCRPNCIDDLVDSRSAKLRVPKANITSVTTPPEEC